MLGKCYTFSRTGMNCTRVEVEVDMKRGLPSIQVTGMLSQEVKEARERVRPAILNSGLEFPLKRITINLAPAETVKSGTHYDTAIAVAILKAAGLIECADEKLCYFGELNLSGEIKWVRGILPLVIEAVNCGYEKIFVPVENMEELSYLNSQAIIAVNSLNTLINRLVGKEQAERVVVRANVYNRGETGDYRDIMGQQGMVEAFKIAAAGNHHMLIVGPPGSGKTMGSSRLPGIMPSLSSEELLEVNMIYSIAAESSGRGWQERPPFRTPHNSSSSRALIGGGPRLLPGEVSLAHKGILFLDEFLEFHRDALQALRTVIERKEAFFSLRQGSSRYPADFLLVAAANPCPCGHYDTEEGICSCTMQEVKKYRRKLRNPLTDRIDIQFKADRVNYKELTGGAKNVSSAHLKEQVVEARRVQAVRYQEESFKTNAALPSNRIGRYCPLDVQSNEILESYMEENLLTARACHKILKIARTIADLEGSPGIAPAHLERALSLRYLDISVL